jgi:hypothetical protein
MTNSTGHQVFKRSGRASGPGRATIWYGDSRIDHVVVRPSSPGRFGIEIRESITWLTDLPVQVARRLLRLKSCVSLSHGFFLLYIYSICNV